MIALLDEAPAGVSTAPGVLVIRLAAPLFFANADVYVRAVQKAVTDAGGPSSIRHVVLDLEAVTDVDVSAAEAFEGLRDWLREIRSGSRSAECDLPRSAGWSTSA